MRTTELYLEQVLIGGLAMTIVLLPWLPELKVALASIDTAMGLAGGSLALGLAFWLGIPLDRLADTLTERLDRHGRLRFALKRAQGSALPRTGQRGRLEPDLYPEDRLRIAALRDREAVVNWIHYHRSRIRLARALALYGPALTLMLAVGVERMLRNQPASRNYIWLTGLFAAYLLWAVLAAVGRSLPRTDEPALVDYADRWGSLDADRQHVVKSESTDLAVWASEWLTLVVPTGLLAAALLFASVRGQSVQWAAAAGTAVTVLSTWAWWRISFTYRTYLYDLGRYADDRPEPV